MEAIISRPKTDAKKSPASTQANRPETKGLSGGELHPPQQSQRAQRTTEELKNTAAHEAGKVGLRLAQECTWDIDAVAFEIAALADRVDGYASNHLESLLRCYSLRIITLNSQLMAFLDQDGTTAGEMHRAVFLDSRPFQGEEQ